jgi:hypothetical protein
VFFLIVSSSSIIVLLIIGIISCIVGRGSSSSLISIGSSICGCGQVIVVPDHHIISPVLLIFPVVVHHV